MDNIKVPILKKDEKVTIEVDYNDSGAIAQALFIIAKTWSPEKIEQFRTAIDSRSKLTDIEMICYVYLDKIYRSILEKAKEEDKVEFTELNMTANPLESNPL